MNILKNEKISAYSHGALVPVMIAGAILLIILAGGNPGLSISLLIYGLSATLLFTASFLYHARKKHKNEKSIWRKIDRSAIFVLIAGTGSPMCFLYLDDSIKWWIIAAQWLLVAIGIAFIFFVNVPRRISTIIYLSMGALCIIPSALSFNTIPAGIFVLFIAGGVAYLAGAVIYAVKKPNLHLDFHEIFHMFVIAGAVTHMIMIISGVNIYIQS